MCKVMDEIREEALREGFKISMEIGFKEGMKISMKEAALRMLEAGKYALEEIANISGLSLEEISQLRMDGST